MKTPYKKSGSKNFIKAKDCYAIKENPTQKLEVNPYQGYKQ
jgi:hypothetical protein